MPTPDKEHDAVFNEPHVVIIGNVIDGIRIFGPFKDRDEATRWGDNQGEGDWYITELQKTES